LKILVTNIRLSSRSGTEIVIRDLASRLSERNHEVVVYTPTIGPIAAGVASLGTTVVDNLLNVPFKPDIIHGHHTPCTAEAIIAFPDVPAIWVCHDAKSWFDQPPRFSQVRRLFAVDETCKARLVEFEGIAADQIEILPNAVDLRRFQDRPYPLPAKPARALSLAKHSGLETLLAEACRQTGLTFEAYGHGVGNPIEDIERRCANADIVFGTARTALEAMAAGAAAVLIDGRGFGGLVTSDNFALGRRLNFGLGMLGKQPKLEMLVEAIMAYDAKDAAEVSQRVRREANLDHTIERLENIYEVIVRENADRSFDQDNFRRQKIEFSRTWLLNTEPAGPWLDEKNALLHHITQLSNQAASLVARNAEIEEQVAEKENSIRTLLSQIDRSERARSVRLAKAIRRLFCWRPG
jgi:hypothetical protein